MREPSTNTQPFHKPLKSGFTGRLKTPVWFLSLSPEESAPSVAIFAPPAGQDRGWTRDRGDKRRGKGGRSGGEVTCSDRFRRCRGQEDSDHYIRECKWFPSISLLHSFISFTYAVLSRATEEGAELLMAGFSRTFHQRHNQLTTNKKTSSFLKLSTMFFCRNLFIPG